jgi:PhnB protein
MPEFELPHFEIEEQLDQAIESVLAGKHQGADGGALAPLTEVARMLRSMPSETFKDRLKSELQRRATMTSSVATATSLRQGFRTVTPFIIHEKAPELVDFLKTAFQAQELKRNTAGEANGFYSEVLVGETAIMIAGGSAASHGNLASALHVFVDDCDAAYERSVRAGAKTLMGEHGKPEDRPYGERSAYIEDPFGNYWYIATPQGQRAGDLKKWGSVVPYLHPRSARAEIDFLKKAFGAEELMVVAPGGRIMHVEMKLGDAMVEMGEPEDPKGIPTGGMFFFVDDVETVYQRALDAGATSVRPPADIPYGSRSAIVKDPGGCLWWPATWIG